MKRRSTLVIPLVIAVLLASASPSLSQDEQSDIQELKKQAVKVYIDCGMCDLEYIKTEITFVNYVRDRKEAHVHILITLQATGGGGVEYTLTFIGQNSFADVKDIQKYFTEKTDTEDEIRRGLVKAIKMGLMSYVGRTPIAGRISVDYRHVPSTRPGRDKWNSWLFSLSSGGHFSGEKSLRDRNINASFSANRVTDEMKIRMAVSAEYSKTDFEYEDETITGTRKGWSANGLFVKSINEHWSAGFYLEGESSTYSNIDLGIVVAPAVEYNLFPYSQSSRRQLRFLYRLSFNPVRYREETIFLKTRETLWRESLSVTLDLREKWGTISTSLSGSHYFHDFKKSRLNIFGNISLNIYKGLSLFVLGGRSWIRDQISLLARELTLEELLLRTRELPTNSNYFVIFGFQFTFGSIFTNVVNPRFGSAGGGGIRIVIH